MFYKRAGRRTAIRSRTFSNVHAYKTAGCFACLFFFDSFLNRSALEQFRTFTALKGVPYE
jgi:hypothetical protein